MEARFNLYDLVAYAIPGFGFFVLLWLVARELTPGVRLAGLKGIEFLATVIAFLGSYLLGHILQTVRWHARKKWPKPIRRIVELLVLCGRPDKVLSSLETPRYSMEYMLEDKERMPEGRRRLLKARQLLTPEFRAKLKKALQEKFDLKMENPREYQEAWNLARTLLIAEGRAGHSELYNSLAQLYAGMSLLLRLALPLLAVVAALRFLGLGVGGEEKAGALALLAVGLVSRGLVPLAEEQFRSLSSFFARSVYEGFYAREREARAPAGRP